MRSLHLIKLKRSIQVLTLFSPNVITLGVQVLKANLEIKAVEKTSPLLRDSGFED